MANIILGPIIGGLAHNRVKLWARADKATTLYAWVGTTPANAKPAGKTVLKAENGYAGVVQVDGLTPNKRYYFALQTAPRPAPPKSAFTAFRTFPPPRKAVSFKFVFGSCFLPLRSEPGLAFKHIRENQTDASFLLMLGDQIYADEYEQSGLNRFPQTLHDFRETYRLVWSNPYHRALLAQTPVFMTPDDHEIENDWHWKDKALTQPGFSDLSKWIRLFKRKPAVEQTFTAEKLNAGLRAIWEHQLMHAPGVHTPRGPLTYEIEFGAAAFLVLDTRTQRYLAGAERSMLGAEQWKTLEEWLLRVKDSHPVKFIASSVSIMSDLIIDNTNDRWTGFKSERERLFEFIARHEIQGVHFIVGDLHTAHEISAVLQAEGKTSVPIREFCASPFEQDPPVITQFFDMVARSPLLGRRKRHFTISQINYGVVHVDFTEKKKPQVKFEVYYENNGRWNIKTRSR